MLTPSQEKAVSDLKHHNLNIQQAEERLRTLKATVFQYHCAIVDAAIPPGEMIIIHESVSRYGRENSAPMSREEVYSATIDKMDNYGAVPSINPVSGELVLTTSNRALRIWFEVVDE